MNYKSFNLFVIWLLTTTPVFGKIYRCPQPDRAVTFKNRPCHIKEDEGIKRKKVYAGKLVSCSTFSELKLKLSESAWPKSIAKDMCLLNPRIKYQPRN